MALPTEGGYLACLAYPGEQPVQAIRECLAIGYRKRWRPSGLYARGAYFFHEFAHRKTFFDIVWRVGVAARIDDLRAALQCLGCEGNPRGAL